MQSAFPKWSASVIFALMGLPMIAGLGVAILGSFGYFPSLGARSFGLEIWREVGAMPGVAKSLGLSLWTGLASSLLAFLFAMALTAHVEMRGARIGAIILATPHAAMATALSFMIAPSGLIARILGFDAPPPIASLQDPYGLGLILGLTLKETPFLWVVMLSASAQTRQAPMIVQARSFGLSPLTAWLKVALPLTYPLIRLPIFVVLAFGISVVDMAQILGPTQPPTLAMATMRQFYSPDLAALLPASAMAVMILGLSLFAIGLWILGEKIIMNLGRKWVVRGPHHSRFEGWIKAFSVIARAGAVFALLALFTLLIWSFAWRWPFPKLLPASWSFALWMDWQNWLAPLSRTLFIGLASTFTALIMAIIWLEARPRSRDFAVYLPLLIPQISFLFGLNILFLQTGFHYGIASVIGAHLFFVFPYMLIALSDLWRKLDERYIALAASFGQSPLKRLWRVKLKLLFRPIALACAIGFSVSIALYLPTIFLGAGRVETLTTEAVTLSSSGDRRIIGVYGSLQMLLPLLGFGLAIWLPEWRFRARRAMRNFV